MIAETPMEKRAKSVIYNLNVAKLYAIFQLISTQNQLSTINENIPPILMAGYFLSPSRAECL